MWNSATEFPRTLLEATSLAYSWPILAGAPRGDGHPVMVLPGFIGGDESTLVLRRYLSRLGYQVLPWKLGQNTGSPGLQDKLGRYFFRISRRLDRPISLIGQSLGGVYARALARRFPDHVRQVITLGTPFSSHGPESTHALVARLFERISGMTTEQMRERMSARDDEPITVPTTAVYSKSDGVVHWSSCLDEAGQETENIEIIGSHLGMAHNPLVFHVLADRLAQAEGNWQPFKRQRGLFEWMFPKPQTRPPASRV